MSNPEVQTELRFNIEGVSLRVEKSSPILSVNGWCFSSGSSEPVELQVRCGKKLISSFHCDTVRIDVEGAFPAELLEYSSVPRCGFEHWVNIPKKFKTVEIYSPVSDVVLKELTSKDVEASGSDWLVDGGGASGRFVALMIILKKAKTVATKETIFSANNWKVWLRMAREDYRRHRYIATASPEGAVIALDMTASFIEKNAIKPHLRKDLEKAIQSFKYQPTISLIMPVYNVDAQYLQEAMESVQAQVYPNWELCIADDASTRSETIDVLKAQNDPRIKISYRKENGHICKTSNDAALQATGDYIALMDNDDLLAPHALFEIARLLQSNPEADVVYSDEDKIDAQGKHFDLHFKPDWSPVLFLGYNYINHLTCIRRSLFEDVGKFRPGYEGAQDYDLLLRVTEKTNSVFHIPKVLYHWRAIPGSSALSADEKPIVGSAAHRILEEALARRGIASTIYQPDFARKCSVPVHQLNFNNEGPSVDIIIPTYNKADILKTCIDSIQKKTTYKNYNIIVVDNDSTEKSTLAYLEKLKKEDVRVEKISNNSERFSFSRINNIAVDRCESELVLFLNNDTEVIDPDWLSRMVGYLQLPDVGATGARLIYPNGTLQHAGVILGMGGGFIPDHAFCRMDKDLPGYFFLPGTTRECSAVTGACLLTRRETFLEVGRFDEQDFKISLNDIDLCLKIHALGLKTLYVAGAQLYHHESLTRSSNDDPAELAKFRIKHVGNHDPYYSINFSRKDNYSPLPECTLDYAELLDRRLRVVFFSHNLNYEGAPNILFDVVRGLKAVGNIAPVIVSPCDGPQYQALVDDGIEVHIVAVRKEGDVLLGWNSNDEIDGAVSIVEDFLVQNKADVVVANVLNTFFVIEAAKRASLPSIWWIHESYDPAIMASTLQATALPRAEQSFEDVNSTLFVSEDTSNMYSRYNTKNNFKVIHNSLDAKEIDTRVTESSKRSSRTKLKIADDKHVIVSVGTVCERKDQGSLLEAARILSQTRDDFVFYLVGYRDTLAYGNHLIRQVEEHDLGDFVKIVAETKDVESYYLAADIFAFASLNESYSLTILEAMSYGLPIVTTRCFGVTEQVRFGVNALESGFKNPQDFVNNISVILDDDEKRKQLGKNSKEMMRYMQSKEEMLIKHEQLINAAYQTGA